MIRLVFLLVFVVFLVENREDYIEYSSNVHDLTDETFEEFLEAHESVMVRGLVSLTSSQVKFYAPWCPHCQALAAAYSEVADIFASSKDPTRVSFALVNCDNEGMLCTEFEILGFPTLKLFRNGDFYRDFEPGTVGKDAAGIARWVRGRVGDPTQTIQSLDDLLHLTTEEGALSMYVGVFSSDAETEVAAFRSAATELDDFLFVEVHDASDELLQFLRLDGEVALPQFVFLPSFADFSPRVISLGGDAVSSGDSLSTLFLKEGYPLVSEVDAASFKRFADSGLLIGILFVESGDDPSIGLLNDIASQHQNEAVFGYALTSLYGAQLELMGGSLEDVPAIAVMDIAKQHNFPFGSLMDETVEDFLTWFNKVVAGEIRHSVRSDHIPTEEQQEISAPVYVIVADTYPDLVMNADRDVLIEFFAPWCQHCRALAPDYQSLAKTFVSIQDTLLIAKMDGSSNDSPDPRVTVEGFPTIVFYPKSGAPVFYEGDRSIESLTAFIRENAAASKAGIEKILGGEETVQVEVVVEVENVLKDESDEL